MDLPHTHATEGVVSRDELTVHRFREALLNEGYASSELETNPDGSIAIDTLAIYRRDQGEVDWGEAATDRALETASASTLDEFGNEAGRLNADRFGSSAAAKLDALKGVLAAFVATGSPEGPYAVRLRQQITNLEAKPATEPHQGITAHLGVGSY